MPFYLLTYWPCESTLRHSKFVRTLVSGTRQNQNLPHSEPQKKSRVLADPTCPANSRSYRLCRLLSHQHRMFQSYSVNICKRLQYEWILLRTTYHKSQAATKKKPDRPHGQSKALQVCLGRQGAHSNPCTPGLPEDPIHQIRMFYLVVYIKSLKFAPFKCWRFKSRDHKKEQIRIWPLIIIGKKTRFSNSVLKKEQFWSILCGSQTPVCAPFQPWIDRRLVRSSSPSSRLRISACFSKMSGCRRFIVRMAFPLSVRWPTKKKRKKTGWALDLFISGFSGSPFWVDLIWFNNYPPVIKHGSG